MGLALNIGVQGPVIAWSWPSYGAKAAYAEDGKVVNWSHPHVATFLSELQGSLSENASLSQAKIHLIAHSMGSRILLKVFTQLARDRKTKNLGSVVFAAGDVGQEEFKSEIEPVYQSATEPLQKSTIYASANDGAIRMSENVHFNFRIGSGGKNTLIVNEAESVDVDLPGHSLCF